MSSREKKTELEKDEDNYFDFDYSDSVNEIIRVLACSDPSGGWGGYFSDNKSKADRIIDQAWFTHQESLTSLGGDHSPREIIEKIHDIFLGYIKEFEFPEPSEKYEKFRKRAKLELRIVHDQLLKEFGELLDRKVEIPAYYNIMGSIMYHLNSIKAV